MDRGGSALRHAHASSTTHTMRAGDEACSLTMQTLNPKLESRFAMSLECKAAFGMPSEACCAGVLAALHNQRRGAKRQQRQQAPRARPYGAGPRSDVGRDVSQIIITLTCT